MDLILWRHAEAEDGFPDEQRKLTGKGHKQAERMARWLSERLPKGYVLLVSPALRTRQTAQALASAFDISPEVGLDASPESVLAAARWPHAKAPVVVVGHQPTLGQTAARLLAGQDASWAVRKGAIFWIRHKLGETSLRAVIGPDLL